MSVARASRDNGRQDIGKGVEIVGTASVAGTSRSLAPVAARAGLCRLRLTVGRPEPCRGPGCPLWEEGGAVVDAGCVVERLALDVEARPHLAWALLHVLHTVEGAPTRSAREEAYRLFRRLVPRAREEEGDDDADQCAAYLLDH